MVVRQRFQGKAWVTIAKAVAFYPGLSSPSLSFGQFPVIGFFSFMDLDFLADVKLLQLVNPLLSSYPSLKESYLSLNILYFVIKVILLCFLSLHSSNTRLDHLSRFLGRKFLHQIVLVFANFLTPLSCLVS